MASMASSKSKTLQMIKCFCGCKDMTPEEVKRIYTLTNSVKQTLKDTEAVTLLQRYLEMMRAGDKSETEQYLDIYLKSAALLVQQETISEENIQELGLDFDEERNVLARLRGGDENQIRRSLKRIKRKYRNEIDASSDFKDFRNAILAKLQRIPK